MEVIALPEELVGAILRTRVSLTLGLEGQGREEEVT